MLAAYSGKLPQSSNDGQGRFPEEEQDSKPSFFMLAPASLYGPNWEL
jgi:hypothetical protein